MNFQSVNACSKSAARASSGMQRASSAAAPATSAGWMHPGGGSTIRMRLALKVGMTGGVTVSSASSALQRPVRLVVYEAQLGGIQPSNPAIRPIASAAPMPEIIRARISVNV